MTIAMSSWIQSAFIRVYLWLKLRMNWINTDDDRNVELDSIRFHPCLSVAQATDELDKH